MRKSQAGNRVIGDMMTLLFVAFAAIVFLILPLINSMSKKTEEAKAPEPQGTIMVELYWPPDLDTDVDLWVMSDADGVPVGYSNKGGPLFNLLRDDLGNHMDISGQNSEITYSRGMIDGEYIVNAHMFNNKGVKFPIPITAVVSYRETINHPIKQLFRINSTLDTYGEEKTLARFTIYDGAYVEKSFNTFPKSIRSLRHKDGNAEPKKGAQ